MNAAATQDSRLTQAYFKPLADGYLFETSSPWLLAPCRHYFVTEEQKSALLGVLRPGPSTLHIVLTATIIMVITCGIALLWWKLLPHMNPTTPDAFGMGALFLIALYVALVLKVRRFLRRIAPVVADAVPTTEKRSMRERFVANTSAMPTKIVVFCLVLWSAAAVVDAVSLVDTVARGSGSSLPTLNFALAVGLALYHAWILRNRRHQVKA